MAQLKSTVVAGDLSVTGFLSTDTAKFRILQAPKTSNDTTYGTGTNGQVLRSNGTSVYWASLAKGDVGLGNVENTALSTWTGTNKITTVGTISSGTWSGSTIAINKGGTGLTSADPHKVLIGPNSGTSAAAPTWRKLMAQDLDFYTGTQTNQVTTSPYQSALWKFNASRSATSFSSGDIVLIKTPGGGGSYGVFVSFDNGSTYRPLCLATTGRYTTHFTANVILALVYDAAGQANGIYGKVDANGTLSTTTGTNNVGGGCWRVMNLYDSGNSNDSAGYVRYWSSESTIKVATGQELYRYQILLSAGDGIHYIPACKTSNSTATNKTTIYTGVFNIFDSIFYYSYTDTVGEEVAIRQDRFWQMQRLDLRYSFNTGTTLAVGKDVYLVAKLQTAATAKLRNPASTGSNAHATTGTGPITQVLPTEDDGYIYIKLGKAYSTSSITLTLDHPIYQFTHGCLNKYTGQNGSVLISLPCSGWTQVTTAVPAQGLTTSDYTLTYNWSRFLPSTVQDYICGLALSNSADAAAEAGAIRLRLIEVTSTGLKFAASAVPTNTIDVVVRSLV